MEKWEAERWYDQYVRFRIYKKEKFKLEEILKPFAMALRPVVLLPAMAYAVVFSYTGVLMVSRELEFQLLISLTFDFLSDDLRATNLRPSLPPHRRSNRLAVYCATHRRSYW